MSGATDTARQDIAAALRAEWRMIATVTLRPFKAGDGFEADLRLDPVIVRGSLEQQGYPRTPEAATKMERRRLAALDQCIQRVNQRLPESDRIRAFSVVG